MAGTIIVDRIESDASYASTINVAGQITFSNTVNFGAYSGTAPVAGFYLPTTNNLAFTTASTERMRIDSAGNVGIGTTSPTTFKSAKLAIRNSASSGESVLAIINNSSNVYEGAGILLGSTAASTNYGATWLYHTYNTNSPTNNTSYAFNISQRATDGTYVSNIWNVDYQNSVTSWYRPNTSALQMQLDASNNLLFNSGYGSAAVAYGCRAWVNFNGTGTVAIRGSGNVTSITDNGVGNYTINFTTAMPDVNYSVSGYCTNPSSRALVFGDVNTYATGSLRINSAYISGTNGEATSVDATYVNISIFR
jgi:hypothetical protein